MGDEVSIWWAPGLKQRAQSVRERKICYVVCGTLMLHDSALHTTPLLWSLFSTPGPRNEVATSPDCAVVKNKDGGTSSTIQHQCKESRMTTQRAQFVEEEAFFFSNLTEKDSLESSRYSLNVKYISFPSSSSLHHRARVHVNLEGMRHTPCSSSLRKSQTPNLRYLNSS